MEQITNNNMLKTISNMSRGKPTMFNISKYIQNTLSKAAQKAFPVGNDFEAQIQWNNTGTSDLASPSAMKIFNMNSRKEGWTLPTSKEVALEIIANVEETERKIIGEILVSQQVTSKPKIEVVKDETVKPGKKKEKTEPPANYFIDINIKDSMIEDIANNILANGIIPETEYTGRNVLVDFSSPNIAKEMHVGHLRSTIIGESLCRILEFLGNDVKRINHVGDWGTQFGMLIAHLEEVNPDFLNSKQESNIQDLEIFYKEAKEKFANPEFKLKAQQNTVLLQSGDEKCRTAWKYICDVSRKEFNKIYQRLDITLNEIGESFYDPIARELVPTLQERGLIELDQGALIMKIPNQKIPLMIVKSDGGLTYDTSDLAALHYRLITQERNWVLYVIGSEQELHLKLVFEGGKIAGWHQPPKTRLDHVAFGLILKSDGKKMATSDGGNIKLSELLDEAKRRARLEIIKDPEYLEEKEKKKNINAQVHRDNMKKIEGDKIEKVEKTEKKEMFKKKIEFSDEYVEDASSKLGYSAVKYFDLKQTRTSQYKFDFDMMLDNQGNTAVYLFYGYVRINSILIKANITPEDIEKLILSSKIKITHPKERQLLIHLIKFNDVIEEIFDDYAINKLCDYVYGISTRFAEYYEECKIVGDDSRILIVELTKRLMKQSFDLLGLTPIDKI